ncbi:unnamed protein product [Zymoseptoria tritici ST99CH_3D7]|uniref:Uncharacterized protein n=1 Tax=Zymoseptoria tritici (strain ST99CH_3D7) TaxID=1276538 RepID=A0A1X7RPG5_ZYMT9|nr:unnamed protein product [Zymoseptoria tritici ST99CH_3D7]
MSVNRSDISHYLLHLVTIWGNMTGSMQPGHAPTSRVNQVRDSGKGHQVLSTSSSKLQPIRGTRATRSTDAAGSEGLPICVSDDEDDDPPTKRQRTMRSAYSKSDVSNDSGTKVDEPDVSANGEDRADDPHVIHTNHTTEDDDVEFLHTKRVTCSTKTAKQSSRHLLPSNEYDDCANDTDVDELRNDSETEADESDVSPISSTSHGNEGDELLTISAKDAEDITADSQPTAEDTVTPGSFVGAPNPYDLLERVLQDVSRDEKRGYEAFIKRAGGIKAVSKIQRAANKSSILNLGGSKKSKKPGVYLHIVEDYEDEEFIMLYDGQAGKIMNRINIHERRFHLNDTPHHEVANRPTSVGTFVVLAEFDEKLVDLKFHLNILEMWTALVFQVLPRRILKIHLTDAEIRPVEIGLNIASPLNQSSDKAAQKSLGLLKHSTNPFAQEYWRNVVLPRLNDSIKAIHDRQAAVGFKDYIEGHRKISVYNELDLTRGAETDAEATTCYLCPPTSKKQKHAQQFFEPIDSTIQTIRRRQVYRKTAEGKNK